MTGRRAPELQTGHNCWRIETATKCAVIVDAEDYFRLARSAMMRAKRRIMLVGWDFDARINLVRGEPEDGAPATVGDLIYWLVQRNPELEVYLLRWDLGAFKSLFRGTTVFTLLKWMRHPRIHTMLDRTHPPLASHHQKIVSIDDCLAFCGGIDMTGDRWDTRAHLDDEPGRRKPNGKAYKPWHDATTALQGPAARALADHCRTRWRNAGGQELQPVQDDLECWPDGLEPQFVDCNVAISRSSPPLDSHPAVVEIEQLYLDQIGRARRFIYAESQYFASRRIAEAIARRLDEPDGPEIVIINPVTAQGWLEPIAMDSARARLFEALRRRDHATRLRMYHPVTARGEPIYVHAKILIVDDEILRVGSSNMNNRSMRLDTECDVTIDVTIAGNETAAATIAAIRNDLLGEHLGVPPETVRQSFERTNSLIAAIEALRGEGRTLSPYVTPNLGDVEAWLADHEVLDPEGPDEMFESMTDRSLLGRLHRRR